MYANGDPDTIDVSESEPANITVRLGSFTGSFTAADIDAASIRINDSLNTPFWTRLTAYPGFIGSVIELLVSKNDFLAGYGILLDTTQVEYSVSGLFANRWDFSLTDTLTVIGLPRGDADGSGSVDVVDLTILVDYLFAGAPLPPVPEAADIDGNGTIDIVDLSMLVGKIFG
ncbi:MAG: dockerin type I repeat-containing protein [Candidatus Zixiibacteriota bacterium]